MADKPSPDSASPPPYSAAATYDGDKVAEPVEADFTTQGLKRKLKARHVQMIAIGSNIGTGLFVGSGAALAVGGPLSLVLGFFLIAISLSIMMQCLGEMSVVIPVSGSFTRYATRFYDRSLGFAMGWQYWLAWVAVFGAEAAAFIILISYWSNDPSLKPLWVSIFVVVVLLVHVCPVRVFGEVEFVVSCIKVVAVVMFIIITWCVMAGAGPDGRVHGGEYWRLPGLENGIYQGFRGLASVFVTAAFAAGGVEMVGIVAGETAQPKWTIPRAIRTLMWRIVLFYVLSMLFLSFVVRYDDENLVGNKNANSSPFVIAIRDAGIPGLPDLLNAVVVICVCSVGSTSVYISSRTLQAMAEDGFAFAVFRRTDSKGRPWVALLFTMACGIVLAYLNVDNEGSTVFSWFSALSGMAFFIAWLVIIACNWRVRAALRAQGDDTLMRPHAFRAPLWPWLSVLAFVAILFMVICQLVVSAWPISAEDRADQPAHFFSQYIGVPIFLVMWAGHKVIFRTSWKKLHEIDLQTGRMEVDPVEEAKIDHYHGLPLGKRLLTYVRF